MRCFAAEDTYPESFTKCHLRSKYPLLLVCVYDIYHAGTYLEPDWILTINKEKDLCDYEQ